MVKFIEYGVYFIQMEENMKYTLLSFSMAIANLSFSMDTARTILGVDPSRKQIKRELEEPEVSLRKVA